MCVCECKYYLHSALDKFVILRILRRSHLPNSMYESFLQFKTSYSPSNTLTLTLIMLRSQIILRQGTLK